MRACRGIVGISSKTAHFIDGLRPEVGRGVRGQGIVVNKSLGLVLTAREVVPLGICEVTLKLGLHSAPAHVVYISPQTSIVLLMADFKAAGWEDELEEIPINPRKLHMVPKSSTGNVAKDESGNDGKSEDSSDSDSDSDSEGSETDERKSKATKSDDGSSGKDSAGGGGAGSAAGSTAADDAAAGRPAKHSSSNRGKKIKPADVKKSKQKERAA